MSAPLVAALQASPPPRLSRAWRAAGVAAIWAMGTVPVLFGRGRCLAAALLHIPCPGCGLTRAAHLLLAGDAAGSVRMHPMLVPCVAATAWLAAATVWATWLTGSPLEVWASRAGRAAVATFVLVQVAMVGLWLLRWLGYFGGAVPV